MSEKTKQEAELPVYEVLKRIKEGGLDAGLLSRETRQLCIEALVVEGYSSGQIANLLKKSDRTIRRDLVEIRKQNAISASPEFASIIGGELLMMARNQYSRLKQIARLNCVEPMDKARGEYMAWLIFKEAAEKLHKIGFLPVTVSAAHVKNAIKDTASKVTIGQDSVTVPDGQPQPVIDPELQNEIACLGPMDREKLIEKLGKVMVEIKEEEQKESSNLLG